MKKLSLYSLFIPILVAFIIGGVVLEQRSQPVHAASGLLCVSTNTLIPSTSKDYGNCFATSTLLFMSPGAGTTTLSLYTPTVDHVGLDIEFAASSSLSRLNWRREVSENNIDWYAVGDLVTNAPATSTNVTSDYSETSWLFASSTAGSSNASARTNGYSAVPVSVALKHVDVYNLQSLYTRFVFYVPTGATNGAVNVRAMLKSANTN